MTKEKGQNKVQNKEKVQAIQWLKKKYKIKYNPNKEKVQNKVPTIQWLKKKYTMKYKQSND